MRSMAISHSMRRHASIAYCIRSITLHQNDDYQLLYLNSKPVFWKILIRHIRNNFLKSIQIQIIANKTVLCKDGSGNWEKANCNYMQAFR